MAESSRGDEKRRRVFDSTLRPNMDNEERGKNGPNELESRLCEMVVRNELVRAFFNFAKNKKRLTSQSLNTFFLNCFFLFYNFFIT